MIKNNEIYDDYKILCETQKKNNHRYFKMVCLKCGNVKECSDKNILIQSNLHSPLNCKENYYKQFIGKKNGDYECIDVFNKNKAYYLKYKCTICEKTKTLKATKEPFKIKHSVANCKENFYNYFIGKTFDDLKIEKITKENNKIKFECKCIKCNQIISKDYRSLAKKINKHGTNCFKQIDDKIYKRIISNRFFNMKQRCNNPNHKKYKYYGGRGIKLLYENPLELYNDFIDEFKEHSEKYGIENTTFDRINVNGNYEKENLRLTTREIQNINCVDKKFFILVKDNEKVICDNAMYFGRIYNLNGRAIGNLIRKQSKQCGGWKLDKILYNVTKENVKQIIEEEDVTTNLIISL